MVTTRVQDWVSTTGSGAQPLWPENMPFSNVNDHGRALMAAVRDWYNAGGWLEYGTGTGPPTAEYISGTQFRVSGADVTAFWEAGRSVKAVGPLTGTIYGHVVSSAYSSNTTVTVQWEGGDVLGADTALLVYGSAMANATQLPWLANARIYLDAGGDTYIEAVGDNDVSFVVGGSASYRMTPNAFTIEGDSPGSEEGPSIALKRQSASPADNDSLGTFYFIGRDADLNDVTYAKMTARTVAVTNTAETGRLYWYFMTAGTQSLYGTMDGEAISWGKGDADQGVTAGAELSTNGTVYATRDAGLALALNRLTSVGQIASFKNAGTEVGALTTVAGGVHLSSADDVIALTGQVRLGSGVIEKWGASTSDNGGAVTVTFATAYPTRCTNVSIGVLSSSARSYTVEAIGTTAFTFSVWNAGGSRVVESVRWTAWGY